jgi:hypothetical protein
MRVGYIAVPDLVGIFGQLYTRGLTFALLVEKAELNPRRMSRK